MPKMNGIEVVSSVRELYNEINATLPVEQQIVFPKVIFLSAFVDN
jgi:CheY-like chemotaxis protein